jgi:hypothetical protein
MWEMAIEQQGRLIRLSDAIGAAMSRDTTAVRPGKCKGVCFQIRTRDYGALPENK